MCRLGLNLEKTQIAKSHKKVFEIGKIFSKKIL
jgi:hypothetical protein